MSFGDVDIVYWATESFEDALSEYLTVALIPGYKPIPGYRSIDKLFQEFRANFIQDKDRVIPNDQELTLWMKKCLNKHYDRNDSYKDEYKIQFCKILVNPKAGKFPINQDIIDEECTLRYKIVVHYSVPEGFWNVYDISPINSENEINMQKKFESVYSRSSLKKPKLLTR